jgi:hypothetical protein
LNKDRTISAIWILIPISILVPLLSEQGRSSFIEANHLHPLVMGFIKFFFLATLGELLGRRLALKRWQFSGISLHQRALVWGLFGYTFSFIFPLFSAGVESLQRAELLYCFAGKLPFMISMAFWKSFFINIIFAFPFMTLHKITDTLIDRKMLFSKWPFLTIWKGLDWDTHWKKVAPTILWFWIPAHTITFSLPPEYRILLAAYLGIVLGIILPFFNAKK